MRTTLVVASLFFAACTEKENTEPRPTEPALATAATTASAAPIATQVPPTATNDPLPAHGNVVQEVGRQITKQNYKSELDKVEKEIDQP